MAFKCINEEYVPYTDCDKHEFVCDAESDITDLPACGCGSVALVIATGDVYIVNPSGAWVKIGA